MHCFTFTINFWNFMAATYTHTNTVITVKHPTCLLVVVCASKIMSSIKSATITCVCGRALTYRRRCYCPISYMSWRQFSKSRRELPVLAPSTPTLRLPMPILFTYMPKLLPCVMCNVHGWLLLYSKAVLATPEQIQECCCVSWLNV